MGIDSTYRYSDVIEADEGFFYVQGCYESETEYLHVSRPLDAVFSFEEKEIRNMLED